MLDQLLPSSGTAADPFVLPVAEVEGEQAVALQQAKIITRLQESCALNRARTRGLLKLVREYRQELALAASGTALSSASEVVVADAGTCCGASATDQNTSGEEGSDSEELRFEEVSADAPVTASDLLHRLGAVLPDTDQDAAPISPPRIGSQHAEQFADDADAEDTLPAADKSAHQRAGGEEKDESIDDYMARLLQRVSTKPAADASAYRPTGPAPVAPLPAAKTAAIQNAAAVEKPQLLTKLPARPGVAPERAADMTAMRELAHMHTRSLLDIHFRRHFFRASVGQMAVVVAALCAGVAFTLLSTAVPIALYLGLIGFAVAIVWGAQYAIALWHLAAVRHGPGAAKQLPRPTVATTSPASSRGLPSENWEKNETVGEMNNPAVPEPAASTTVE